MLLSVEELYVRFQQPKLGSSQSFFRRWLTSNLPTVDEARWILHGLNLRVEKNDFLVILGPSGSGKSTLLRAIAGLARPSSGRVQLNGNDITHQPPHHRDLALVFQNGGWYDHLTVEQHFQFDSQSKASIERTMQQLDLTELKHQRPGELSGGQAQRLAIGRALLRGRSLMMLDEPLSQLDQSIRESIRELLKTIHAEQKTFVYVTHDQQDAMHLATKVAILHRGQIQQIGTPQELFDAPNHRCVAEMIGTPSMQFFDASLSAEDYSKLRALLKSGDSIADTESIKAIEFAMTNGSLLDASDCRLQVGIRPGAWEISPKLKTAENVLQLDRISFLATFVDELFLGHQRRFRFVVSGSSMPSVQVVRSWLPERLSLVAGEQYRLSLSVSELYFFDSRTGENVSSI